MGDSGDGGGSMNTEHYEKLKDSVVAWNEWRHNNLDATPDLVKADLRWANLTGAELTIGGRRFEAVD